MNITNILNTIEKNKKWHFWIFFAVLLFLTIFMMYHYNTFNLINQGHDAPFQFNRFVKLVESIKNGTFPIYIDNGVNQYGYATKLFYPDFILIPFALIGCLIGYVKSYQLIYFTVTILCGLLSYLSVKNIYKNNLAAYISAILYTFSLYRLQDLYDRSALGETITFAFIPLIFWGIHEIIKGDYKKWYIISIGFSLCILTHVLSALLGAVIILIIVVLYLRDFIKEPKRIKYLFIAACSTVLIAAYYIFPYCEQIINDSFNYQNFTLADNFGKPAQKIIQGMFLIGITDTQYSYFVPSIGLTLTLPLFFRFFIYDKTKNIRIADLAVLFALILIVFAFDNISFGFYKHIKLFAIIQFAWRFFEYVSFFLALACGLYLSIIVKNDKRSMALLSALLLIMAIMIVLSSTAYKYRYQDIGSNLYEKYTKGDLKVTKESFYYLGAGNESEYFPIPVSITNIEKRGSIISKQHPDTEIKNIKRINTDIFFDIKLDQNESLELPIVYYKGYYAQINNKNIPIQKSKNGLIEIPINESGSVHVEFTGTPIQKYSLHITLISILLLCIYIYWYNRKNKKPNKSNHVNTII